MKIIAIGDSLTYGYLLYEDEKWTKKLKKKLNNDIINKGQNGDTSEYILGRFKTDVVSEKADIVLIWAGVNDFFTGSSLANVTENIDKMIEIAMQNKILPVIVISTPVNSNKESFYPDSSKIDAVNEKIQKMSSYYKEKKVLYIDLYAEFKNFNGNIDIFYIDDVHISPKGADFVTMVIYDYLNELLKHY